MAASMRSSTLETIGLGSVLATFERGRLPVDTAGLVDQVFGPADARGALVVSGHGLSTNIIEASLEAYLVAANKLHGAEINGIEVAFVGRRMAEELP